MQSKNAIPIICWAKSHIKNLTNLSLTIQYLIGANRNSKAKILGR